MTRRSVSSKMLFNVRAALFGIVLVMLLASVGYYLSLTDRIYRIKVSKFEGDFRTKNPVATIHRDTGEQDREVACVVEPALTNCGGTGFASVLLQTIDDLTTCLTRGLTPTVIWMACDSCGPSGPGRNYWTWYFEAINPGIENRTETRVCMGISREYFKLTSAYPRRPGAEGKLVDFRFADMENKISSYFQPITAEIRALVSYVISGYIKPAPRVRKMVDTFYQSFMAERINIGVHVRLLEEHVEEMIIMGQKTPKLQDFLRATKHIMDDIKTEQGDKEVRIFLASDRADVIASFEEEFGKANVVHTTAFRGEEMDKRLEDRVWGRHLGDQVFMDILLMSKCDYLIHDESNVASVAYYFNPNIQSFFVCGDASDHKRLNGQSRDDPVELLRQAVAKETSINWDQLEKRKMISLLNASDDDKQEIVETLRCFFRNMKWSKCGREFAASKRDGLSAFLGF
ncbi:uncharacterized protein [Branchiostoma lanceolatum]|uniref:uncharacterized protein n=1 Tax=Branchiostoma lanceolatum TaxID=7740 RepID=UPI00345735AA